MELINLLSIPVVDCITVKISHCKLHLLFEMIIIIILISYFIVISFVYYKDNMNNL